MPCRQITDAMQPTTVAICITTFSRPQGLDQLLSGIGSLKFAHSLALRLKVVVADNNPDGSAKVVCERHRARLPFLIAYCHEPHRGISHARNAAIAGSADAQLIAFIDDDELPEEHWLDELISVLLRHDADVVCGPVLPVFTGVVPDWVRDGGYFERPRHRTGERLDALEARTGNVLLRRKVFDGMDEPFHPALAASGGEDTHFFICLQHQGRKIVWADEAIVRETISPARAGLRWLLRRALRIGNSNVRMQRLIKSSPRLVLSAAIHGAARIVKGLAAVPFTIAGPRHRAVRALQRASNGLGMILACLGISYNEYTNSSGD